ncbi:hypothetical protein C1701_12135 [Actinoalloteichus sp. AHMU CJ021]|nr:hypothetical protein C1701_12135 [Actinoalloteichus sp. AHMU CJ021]
MAAPGGRWEQPAELPGPVPEVVTIGRVGLVGPTSPPGAVRRERRRADGPTEPAPGLPVPDGLAATESED